jgi:serine/threonine protein kinase/cytochrome c-type biogenesis protein CcmH/NrfG
MRRCPNCKNEYPDTFKVCPQDGGKLDEETVVLQAPTVAVPTVPVAAPSGGGMIGRTIANRFRIEKKLGEGGMGAVYKAEHVKMNRPCAIKILSDSALNDPEALPRFNREAQMSSRIDHPNAVTIYDYGESEDGLVYLAMEFVEGETLTKVLERDGRFPLERALRVARQIGAALDAAHALGIVHRDLKPDNIMLARRGDAEVVKVLDFGIAKLAESEDKRMDLTQAGLIIGTPFYMSPEQVGGEKLDPRSDIYSFALIVYEMLTGGLPFSGQNTQAVMISRLTTTPRSLRMINPDIPPAVDAAVMHALERERDVRTPTAGKFVEEFEAAIGGRGPDLGRAPTSPHAKPDTAVVRSPVATPPGSPPVFHAPPTPSFPPAGPMTPMGSPPVFPTDRAPNPAPGYAPTQAEQNPFAPRAPYPAPGPAPNPFMAVPQAPPRKSGGAGLLVGGLLLLLLVGGGAAVLAVGWSQGWFSKGTAAGPGTTGGPTTGPGGADAAEAERLFQEGYQLQSKNDNEGAISKYRAAIARQPQFPKAYRNLGAALANSGQYEDAIRALDTAMQQDPAPNDQVFYNLGLSHFKLKNYLKAAESFQRAGQMGNDPDAYAFAGFAYDNAGNKQQAGEAYRKYLAASPDGTYAGRIKDILDGKGEVPTADEFEM